jgi:hypothetical protein
VVIGLVIRERVPVLCHLPADGRSWNKATSFSFRTDLPESGIDHDEPDEKQTGGRTEVPRYEEGATLPPVPP